MLWAQLLIGLFFWNNDYTIDQECHLERINLKTRLSEPIGYKVEIIVNRITVSSLMNLCQKHIGRLLLTSINITNTSFSTFCDSKYAREGMMTILYRSYLRATRCPDLFLLGKIKLRLWVTNSIIKLTRKRFWKFSMMVLFHRHKRKRKNKDYE